MLQFNLHGHKELWNAVNCSKELHNMLMLVLFELDISLHSGFALIVLVLNLFSLSRSGIRATIFE